MLARYHELTAKVDAFFARVAQRHRADVACAVGCDRCCHVRLTVTGIEAAAIEAWAVALPAAERRVIAAAAAASDPAVARCAALDPVGRCRIYPARPLVCRSHGLPIRLRDRRGLPVIESCELTFRARGPAAADPDCVLDQELVSATLGLIDRAHAEQAGVPAARVDLAAVLAGLDGRGGDDQRGDGGGGDDDQRGAGDGGDDQRGERP